MIDYAMLAVEDYIIDTIKGGFPSAHLAVFDLSAIEAHIATRITRNADNLVFAVNNDFDNSIYLISSNVEYWTKELRALEEARQYWTSMHSRKQLSGDCITPVSVNFYCYEVFIDWSK